MTAVGSKSISPQRLADYQESFRLFDQNGDGSITSQELQTLLTSLGQKIDATHLRDIIRSVDKNSNGVVDFDEFVELMERATGGNGTKNQKAASSEEEELRNAFNVFDKDGNGTISLKELTSVMEALGEKLTPAQLQEMMQEADLNGDGEINFQEFVKMMNV